jgi:hypothetical protein
LADLALNVAKLVVAGLVSFWVLIGLQVVLSDSATRFAWHSRGLFQKSSPAAAFAQTLASALFWFLPPALVVGLLIWLVPRFAAGAFHGWGAWVGVGLAALAAVLALIATPRAERMGQFYGEHREELAPKLGIRQQSYLKAYRDAWDALEKAKPAATSAEAEAADEPPHLDFEVLAVERGRMVTDAAPWTADGGDWTVLRCRTTAAPAASFAIAERSGESKGDVPFAWGEARLWVPTASDGARLADAIGDAFLVRGGRTTAPGGSPRAPLSFNTAVLSRATALQPDGSFAGSGSWTATKWFFEEATEFYVNWSVAEKKGRFSEKDEDYRSDLYAAFRGLAG